MTDDESFADAPVSVGELRSDKNHNGADWSPREALVATLRDIDSGKIKPTALVISMAEPGNEPSAITTSFRNSTPNALIAYGLLVQTMLRIGRHEETER